MSDTQHTYIAIDLKSFYASAECMDRGLDPLTTHLVVADASRTEKTICLAVSPSLRSYGIPGRVRLFEVIQKVREINAERRAKAPGHTFSGESSCETALQADPSLALSYLVAPPRMAYYMEFSTRIYHVYLKYIAPEDIHVYSIDEVFMDVTHYLDTYGLSPRDLAMKMIRDVLQTTGITATAGIGPNLYLCKIALDIGAKHIKPDKDGVRIAELDEASYRRMLWAHRPLTDFWRVGRGYAKKLEEHGLFTMGDIARCSLGKPSDCYNEELLYDLFGVNAELLIDHAWGYEPCTIKDIKAYRPQSSSIGSGQVLPCPYTWEQARKMVREMADSLALSLVDKGLVSCKLVLTIGYDIENLKEPSIRRQYEGEITTDRYGRKIPKHAHGTANLSRKTSSSRLMQEAALALYDRIADRKLLVRRINISADCAASAAEESPMESYEQLDLFTDYEAREKEQKKEAAALEKEQRMQKAMLDIKKKFGKNAILKGMNLEEGSTAVERNNKIGGHRA